MDKSVIENATERVKELITATGLSQAKFAQACEISPSNLCRVINRGDNISTQYLFRMAHAFGASYEWLSTGEGSMFDDDAQREVVSPLDNVRMTMRVKELMQHYGYDQKTLAEVCGVDSATISRCIKGKLNWSDRTMRAIAQNLHTTFTWLKKGYGQMVDENQSAILQEPIDDNQAKMIMQQLGGHHNNQSAQADNTTRDGEIELLKKMVADKDKEIEFLREMLAKKQ